MRALLLLCLLRIPDHLPTIAFLAPPYAIKGQLSNTPVLGREANTFGEKVDFLHAKKRIFNFDTAAFRRESPLLFPIEIVLVGQTAE